MKFLMDFKYVSRNVPGQGAILDEFQYNLVGCQCKNVCRVKDGCTCLNFGVDFYDENGCLKVASDSTVPFLECHENCTCGNICGNRSAQFGLTRRVEPFLSELKGFGLRALEPIPSGCFVIEYTGEIISKNDAAERAKHYKENRHKHNYIFTVKEHTADNCQETFIDATKYGNMARFINHSCNPNLTPVVLRYGRIVPALALFSTRNIEIGQELHYDYGKFVAEYPESLNTSVLKKCHCESINCRGFLNCSEYKLEKINSVHET